MSNNTSSNKRDCVTTQSPQSTSSIETSKTDPGSTATTVTAHSAVSGGRMTSILSSASSSAVTSNPQSPPLLASVKTTPASARGVTSATSTATTKVGGAVKSVTRSASTRTSRSLGMANQSNNRRSDKSASRAGEMGLEELLADHNENGGDGGEGGATIIRQATANSPTRTVKIPGLGSKLFKKCKSATFQIDGATYTIGKYRRP